ncbi:MAG TPA: hypothetical protein VK138_02645 [Acidiferrobacterales bacterium]|nr:hypothetical protein [Acidiferrobacterales bacterium]
MHNGENVDTIPPDAIDDAVWAFEHFAQVLVLVFWDSASGVG